MKGYSNALHIGSTLRLVMLIAVLALGSICAGHAHAQEFKTSGVTSEYRVVAGDEDVASGDIIAHEGRSGVLTLADDSPEDELFGVIVEEPVLLFRNEAATSTYPIARDGEVVVNVSTAGGSIAAGDYVTASNIPGVGRRAQPSDRAIIGVAREPFGPDIAAAGTTSATTTATGEEIVLGSIVVQLQIGDNPGSEASQDQIFGVITEATLLNVIQYIVAGFIAIGAVSVAFRNFGPSLQEGIQSMGRNPRARSAILSMVAFNAFLIILVSAAGLALSVAIILAL
jgi:hypothetical protein